MAPRSKSPAPSGRLGAKSDLGMSDRSVDRVYTWEEVAKHNTAESAWVIVKGKVYDVTSWLDRHPGGKEMLLLCAGRECTELFASYHPFTKRPAEVISKFEIGTVANHEFPLYTPDSGFYSDVCDAVGKYFHDKHLDPRDPLPGLWRMALVFGTAAFCYAAVNNIVEVGWWGRIAAAVVFGIVQALPLLHVMHDSSHTAFGPNENWWKIAGRFCMDWYAGACMISWHHQHVVGHHIYTNVLGADPDMPVAEEGDPRRLVSRQMWSKLYRWQHLYLPPLYGILGLKFRLQDVMGTYFDGSNGPIRVNYYDTMWFRIFFVKAVWAVWRIVVPLYYLGVPASQYWGLFFITEVMTGYWLAFNFQVSHISEVADFPNGEKGGDDTKVEDEWAVSQVKASVDYSHGNWLTTFVAGALNYQTVHHLFPGVSQYHYPDIAPIVMRVAKAHGIKYLCLPDFATAWRMHVEHLRQMGAAGKAAHID